ncbi:MAG TPA: hypothetical protein VHZ52_07580 [Acidobacteriaceae bacterium]|jgi:AGZA family xanthine/uracil permease-like MFS transporter|nr:hypothetical protein [Acidobacteriaceae bacterium]
MAAHETRLPWFTSGDVDGFFGLFFSGFPDLLLIVGLAPVCGFSMTFVAGRVLPGVALSVLAGNLFYAWQARRLAAKTGRGDVTAIPFGINTPTIFAYVFLIMGPVYARTHDAEMAWHAGVFASLLSGLVQTAGAFGTDWLRRHTPRAALLCPLAGLALAYLCLGFVFGAFQQPAVALLPMIVLFALYASRVKLPGRIPPALLAIGLGAALVAVLRHFHLYADAPAASVAPGIYLPHAVNVAGVIAGLLRNKEALSYLSIIVPLAALDTLASLQILESVKAAGDDFATRPSLLMNGVGTLVASCLGSPFPTTLYVGHAAHKANGARSGYSALNGLMTLLLCVTGVLPLVLRVVPLEVAGPVVVWFGLVTVGQAFVQVPSNQAIAVAMGLIPMLAQWATGLAETVLEKAGSSLMAVMPAFTNGTASEFALGGLIALGQGGLLTSMMWAAALALAVQRKFVHAAAWMGVLAVLAAFGVIHAYALTPGGAVGRMGWWVAPEFALAYGAGAVFLLALGWMGARVDISLDGGEN